jgi:hypothetical protein
MLRGVDELLDLCQALAGAEWVTSSGQPRTGVSRR